MKTSNMVIGLLLSASMLSATATCDKRNPDDRVPPDYNPPIVNQSAPVNENMGGSPDGARLGQGCMGQRGRERNDAQGNSLVCALNPNAGSDPELTWQRRS